VSGALVALVRLVSGLGFAEGPRWHQDKLWFSDFGMRLVRHVDLAGKVTEVVRVPGRPSGLGFLPDGRLLLVSMDDRQVLRLEHGLLHQHADLSGYTRHACNDMVLDREGNAFVGHMGFDLLATPPAPQPAELIYVRANGETQVAARDLSFPNGPAITPDGRTLIVAETFGGRLTAFDVGDGGTLSNRRVFASLPGRAPDGICLDAEGAVWVADARGKACVRVREGGEVTDVIDTERGCYACALGGSDGKTLFLCTAEGYDPAAMARCTGAIDTLRVAVPAAHTAACPGLESANGDGYRLFRR
jgi:sugar lactone lactonase YvrE